MDMIQTIATVIFLLVVALALIAVADVLLGKRSGRGNWRERRAQARQRVRERAGRDAQLQGSGGTKRNRHG